MAGYDFTVQPAQIESPISRYGKLMQLRQGQQDADARKIELQQKQMELDQAKKAQKLKDTQEAVATSAYRPQTANMGNIQLPGGSIPMGSVQGPAQLDRGAYTQGLQKAGYGYEAMQADQGFQKQDADAATASVELRKKLADVTTVDLTNHSKSLELTAQLAQPVDALEQQGAPPEVLQKAYNDSLVAGARAGMDVSQLPKVYQPGMARQYMYQAVKAKDIFDNEITLRGQDKTAETAKAGQEVTKRGQDMTDKRMRDANDIAREDKVDRAQAADNNQLTSFNSSMDRLATAAKELRDHPGLKGITGLRGAVPNIPGSAASDAAAKLTTLKSQVAFGTLQEMRSNSKTGGALGQVSDNEGRLLQSNLAPLENAQSYEEYVKSLDKIIDYADKAKGRASDAVSRKYSKPSLTNQGPTAKEIRYKVVNGQLVPE